MFPIPEQFSVATKANFESQLEIITALTNKAFESVEKIVDLNMNAVKASLEESAFTAHKFMAAKDPQEFFNWTAAQSKPSTEKALVYSRHLANIASSAQAEFTKAAETQIAETNRKVMSLIEDVTKNAPAGSESAIAMFKSALGNANAGYEQLTKTSKQAVEALEANLNTTVSKFSDAAVKAGSTKK